MSSPSNSTCPRARAPGTTSCIRLRQRRKVDLPQPDGPISAVICRGATSRLMLSSALNAPYQAFRLLTASADGPPTSGACVSSIVGRYWLGRERFAPAPFLRCSLATSSNDWVLSWCIATPCSEAGQDAGNEY